MKKKALWITRTAVMLALLITLQWATKALGQLVTGSCVNAVLAVSALLCGWHSALVVAVLSPLFAYLLGIAPNLIAVPVIMVGNTLFVLLLSLLPGNQTVPRIFSWLAAAFAKFAAMYALIVWGVCGLAADTLLAAGVLKKPMLNVLPATFSWPQLLTALIGGGIAVCMVPGLKKALHKT